jgi:hypothetical protein
MAETILVTQALSNEMIEAGRAMLARLAENNWRPSCAYWLLDEENGRWKLILSSADIEARGAKPVLELIRQILIQDATIRLRLSDVRLTPSWDTLSKAIIQQSLPAGTRLTQSSADGHYVADAYIYRS